MVMVLQPAIGVLVCRGILNLSRLRCNRGYDCQNLLTSLRWLNQIPALREAASPSTCLVSGCLQSLPCTCWLQLPIKERCNLQLETSNSSSMACNFKTIFLALPCPAPPRPALPCPALPIYMSLVTLLLSCNAILCNGHTRMPASSIAYWSL